MPRTINSTCLFTWDAVEVRDRVDFLVDVDAIMNNQYDQEDAEKDRCHENCV